MSDARTKSFTLRVKASTPDDAQLAAIRTHTLRDFAADELMVREYILAHNGIDRDNECFASSLLDDFARSLPGKGVFVIHPTSWQGSPGPGEGKVFAARTERVSFDEARKQLAEPGLKFPPGEVDAVLLKTHAYYVKTPDNESFLLKLDAGIGTDVSIGFKASGPERMKDIEGRELNVWRWNSPGMAAEMSHVWLGAQPGARATKSASQKNEDDTVDEETKARLKALETERDQHKAAADANTKATAALTALKTALGTDHEKLIEDPAALAQRVKDGAEHRKALIDDLVKGDRQAKLVGDSEEAVKSAREMYSGLPTTHLQQLLKRYDATGVPGPAQGSITGADPAQRAPGEGGAEGDQTKGAAGPFGSSLLG